MPAKKQKYILVGGGSGGPVSPLLALAEELGKKIPELEPVFVGSGSPEDRMAKKAGIKFLRISSGKYRRYFSLKNLFTPFWVVLGFYQSIKLIRQHKPVFAVGTGSFVQVPVLWASWILGVPVFIHQQDYIPSLANRLCAIIAKKITVTFPKSKFDFQEGWTLDHNRSENKVIVTGNPVRKLKLHSRTASLKHFKLDPNFPTIVVMGGGTGALSLNFLTAESIPELTSFCNVIHLCGQGKLVPLKSERYLPLEFADDMGLIYSAADLIVCRAGLGTLSELAYVKKPALVIPLPGTHQEYNALYLNEHDAALVVEQNVLTPTSFSTLVRGAFFEHKNLAHLASNLNKLLPADADVAISKIIRHNIG